MDYSYYGRKAPNQMVGYISNPCEGLNEFVSPIRIGDNQLSDCVDVLPYRNSAISMYSRPADITPLANNVVGRVVEARTALKEGDTNPISYYNNLFTLSYKEYGGENELDASYSQSETTVTVVFQNHGLSTGEYITIHKSSPTYTMVDGSYIITKINNDSFSYTAPNNVTGAGACIFYKAYINFMALPPASTIALMQDISEYGFPANFYPQNSYYSSCNFATQAANYVVFSYSDLKKLIYVNVDTSAIATVTLPFYPKRIVSHANRIFAIDTRNTIWWCKAGTFTNATDWYGIAPSGSSVIEDSGYWVIERERLLSELFVIDNNLFIFGTQNIYIFSGYSYDTFAMQIAFPNLGIESETNIRYGVQTNKNVYFISSYNPEGTKWLGSDEVQYYIYEFNGSSFPTVISKPIIEAGQITNGMLGSIDMYKQNGMTHLSADSTYVYVYKKAYNYNLIQDNLMYVFDIKTRTWWKRNSFSYKIGYNDALMDVIYFPSINKDATYSITNNIVSKNFDLYDDIGIIGSNSSYIITKAFSSLPTDKETLTAIIFQLKATAGTDLAYTLSISNSIDQDDFKIAKQVDHHIATGTIENVEIFLPVSIVPNVRQYRIKLQVFNGKCYIYNIERRFRVRGRSR